VYPRCAAVIHHGGIGTVAQALRAGVPALVVPWGADQYLNAAQVAHLGAGRWLQRHFYTAERAVHGLDALLHQAWYRERAQALATQIAKEDGVGTLCDALEAILRRAWAR
jgi:rhamnosyltransferase subunit B